MKESIGYTVTLNIMIVFITIIVAFFSFALIYFKSNKVSNVITTAIEKYEDYDLAVDEINRKLSSIGYGSHAINCENEVEDKGAVGGKCNHIASTGSRGYCVYVCYEEDSFDDITGKYKGDYFYYKVRTNMMFNIPIIHDILDIPIYSNTNRLYNFKKR